LASLNLEFNPTAIAAHAVVFITSIGVVKKLYVDPYMKLRDKRDHATINQKARAQDLVLQNEELGSEIHAKFEKAKDEIHQVVDVKRNEMKERREEILALSNQKARELLEKVRTEIGDIMKQEEQKLTTAIPALTDELFQKTVN